MTDTHSNIRVKSFEPIASPAMVINELPANAQSQATTKLGRQSIRDCLAGIDRRPLVIIGPCSIHDPDAAYEYAARLMKMRTSLESRLNIVMRVYFEKPRTTVGWKGLINDPHLDGTHDISSGLRIARRVLLKITEMGMPAATEFLDPIVPQYTADLVSWAAIGARTTESQTHRQMASGLSMPVGFKNATDGGLQVAVDAMASASAPHAFVGIDDDGRTAVVRTTGNQDVHIVLRGGSGKTNFGKADIAYAKALIDSPTNQRRILVDCSHGNSAKNHANQPKVFLKVLEQICSGESAILGMMIESHLIEGRQDHKPGMPLIRGLSITDACIGWDDTEKLLTEASNKLESSPVLP